MRVRFLKKIPSFVRSCRVESEHAKLYWNVGLSSLLIAAMAFAVTPAKADSLYTISFSGHTLSSDTVSGTLSGDITLDVSNTPVANVPGAFQIIGITGTFTDTSIGLLDATIGGLAPVSGAPSVNSDGTFAPTGALNTTTSPTTPFTYDNLFYPDGNSPVICPPDPLSGGLPGYPFSGGVLDIYGLSFYADGGGYAIDLWSNGVTPQSTPDVAYEVDDSYNGTAPIHPDIKGGGVPVELTSTPEPGSLFLLGTGILGLLGVAYRSHRSNRCY